MSNLSIAKLMTIFAAVFFSASIYLFFNPQIPDQKPQPRPIISGEVDIIPRGDVQIENCRFEGCVNFVLGEDAGNIIVKNNTWILDCREPVIINNTKSEILVSHCDFYYDYGPEIKQVTPPATAEKNHFDSQ